jgi:hypothetical protein
MEKKPFRWTDHDDQLFRELVESGATLEAIAGRMNRTAEELKRRGYVLGLPLKWFKPRQLGNRSATGAPQSS